MLLRALIASSISFAFLVAPAALRAQPDPKPKAAQPAAKPADAPPAAPTAPLDPEEDPDKIPPVGPPAKLLSNWREAIALASAENPDYSVALLEVERLKGVERQTLAGTLPIVSATGQVTFNLVRSDIQTLDFATGETVTTTIPSSPTAAASFALRQPLIAPRVWWAIGTAKAQTDLARTTIEDRKRTLTAAVADAIVTVVTAERMADVNRVGLKAALERLRLQRKRRELGSGTELDIVRFEQDVVIARSTLITGDESLRQARERLGLALGSTEGWGVKPDISIDDIQTTLDRVCKKGDLADRADLRALKQQKEILRRSITDADLLYAPTADLTTSFTYSSEDLIGDKNYAFSIQGVLSVPIWDGGARYGIRRQAKAVVEQQGERLDAATRAASVEVNQASRAVAVAEQSLAVATKARNLAKQTDELVRKAMAEGGNVTSFDLVDASRRLREAELSLTVRELELVRAKIAALLAASNCTE